MPFTLCSICATRDDLSLSILRSHTRWQIRRSDYRVGARTCGELGLGLTLATALVFCWLQGWRSGLGSSTDLKKELDGLKYPLHFADFESINPAIPRFVGMRPYAQIPFQWSLHLQKEPGATLEHFEFLATDRNDPRTDFISSLCAALGESGSIVVYSWFESQRLSELSAWLPEFADQIKNIQARLFDLLPVVREHTYHPAYAGSYSIKSVLPALVPEMTYDGMEVANGQAAGVAWERLMRERLDQAERERIQKALLEYCGQDTLAMVKLTEKLRFVCG